MDDIQERTLLEAITSIDETLKRLSERFCEEKSVDVAEIDKQKLVEQINDYLRYYDSGKENYTFWGGKYCDSRKNFAALMADVIWRRIQIELKSKPPHSPLPD